MNYFLKLRNLISKDKLLKNLIIIFSGEGISSVFSFLSTIFIVKSLGNSEHGVLVAIQTYVNFFYGVFSFKTFQSLIKFLARSESYNDDYMSKVYIKVSFLLDCFCLILMLIIGLHAKDYFIGLLGWNSDIAVYCDVYLCVYLLYFQGSTIGILRFYEQYDYIVKSNIICSFIKMIGFAFCYCAELKFVDCFGFYCIANISKFLFMNYYTLLTLKKQKLSDFYKVRINNYADFISFSFYSNLTSTIDLPVNQITTMIINKYLGFEAISVYNIFQNIGAVINKLGDPISQVIYPEMNQLISKRKVAEAKMLKQKLYKVMFVAFVGISLFILVSHKLWLSLLINKPEPYLIPLIVYIAYACYSNASMGTHNLFMALGYVKYNIPILIVINTIYLLLLFLSIQNIGLLGVIFVYIFQTAAVVIIKERIMVYKDYKEM